MGFRKTGDGRVFFKSASNDEKTSEPKAAQGSNGLQMEVLGLLRALNTKLSASEKDRDSMRMELQAYRQMVSDLEEKSDRAEKAYLSIQQRLNSNKDNAAQGTEIKKTKKLLVNTISELEQTRKLILELEDRSEKSERVFRTQIAERQKAEQQLKHRQSEDEQRFESLITKIEETSAKQEKLDRKIEKAVQDRARFMRKIERIEETVIQTNESLNAKAMVLLTDQSVAGHAEGVAVSVSYDNDSPVYPEEEFTEEDNRYRSREEIEAAFLPWWRRPIRANATALASVAVIAVLAGWGISQIQKPAGFELPEFDIASMQGKTFFDFGQKSNVDIIPNVAPSQNNFIQSAETNPQTLDQRGFGLSQEEQAMIDQAIERSFQTQDIEMPAIQPPQAQTEMEITQPSVTSDDLGAVSLQEQAQLEALLEDKPDEVAGRLNAIEPSAVQAEQSVQKEIKKENQVVQTKAKKQATPSIQNAEVPSSPSVALTSMAKDPSLPEKIKPIEVEAFAGNPEAQHDLGAIYTAGHAGVPQDYERAALWFEHAALNGIANASYNLGVLHHQGIGVSQDIVQALVWYQKAADQNHPEAQYNLAIAFIEGIGVEYNPQTAAQHFESAAEFGIVEAAYNLGLIHENGLLGEAKPDEALMWYKIASDEGSPEAKAALQQLANALEIKLSDVENIAESMRLLKENQRLQKIQPSSDVSLQRTSDSSNQAMSSRRIMVSEVQQYLMDEGLYPGPADGLNGPLTQDAIRSYQARNSLKVDGNVTSDLLSVMQSNAAIDQGSRAE